jgi:Zn-dependent peptidase ImmA (M78 family)/DNA-binding XRE family transcriptional regulator
MTDERFSPQRLRLARQRRGVFANELAAAVGVTATAVSRWENGKAEPESRHIEKLGEVLAFPREFFFGAAPPNLHQAIFRSLNRMTARQRDMVLASGAQAVALDAWIDARFTRPAPALPDLRDMPPERAAESLRAAWGLGFRAISNMVHLMEAHGVRVYSLAHQGAEVDAFSDWQGNTPFVFLNTEKTAERSRMDAAHELGHLVLHAHTNGGTTRVQEGEAQGFASELLMPARPFLASVPRKITPDAVIEAKQQWGVSAMAFVYRMHKLQVIADWHYQTLCIHFKSRYARTEPGPLRPRETSQILAKVFGRGSDGRLLNRHAVARDLRISTEDLDAVTFGLILHASDGGASPSRTPAPSDRKIMRLIR